ncbi:hypothetical protein BCR39DRAFT_233407 [Naematelia encephala]|uniref:HhH-GPD domain-containing protein n=1 Tax=Naematelia encephala TaxID=71784 RepID=A0A1Y2BGU3_9TREE|nr:hypothetical protein BCR39DRAFT_233407 [Naematelia encephala]
MLRALHILGQMDHNLFLQPVATSSNDPDISTTFHKRKQPPRHASSSIIRLRSHQDQDQDQDQSSSSNIPTASLWKPSKVSPETPAPLRDRSHRTRKVESTSSDLPPTPDSLPRSRTSSSRRIATGRKRKIQMVEVTDDLEPHGLPTPRSSPKRTKKQADQATPRRSGRNIKGVGSTTTEEGIVQPIRKIHLIQERVRHDPWRMLVATSLLNVTSGRAARPIYEELLRRWPTSHTLANGQSTLRTSTLLAVTCSIV